MLFLFEYLQKILYNKILRKFYQIFVNKNKKMREKQKDIY